MKKKLTTVIGLFLLALFTHLLADQQPKAFIVTGEQSGEDLARWFVHTTKLSQSHEVFIVASKTLAQELSSHPIGDFDDLARVTILHGISSLFKELILQHGIYKRLIQKIVDTRPERLILIDRPWVNVRLARAIKKSSPLYFDHLRRATRTLVLGLLAHRLLVKKLL